VHGALKFGTSDEMAMPVYESMKQEKYSLREMQLFMQVKPLFLEVRSGMKCYAFILSLLCVFCFYVLFWSRIVRI
jgi:hypothetical protein